jgi:hypothetical protein
MTSVTRKDIQSTAFPGIAGRLSLRRGVLRAVGRASEFRVLCALTMMFLAAASAVSLRAIGAITAFY